MTPLAALESGTGPSVLVVPGLTFPARSWEPVLPLLAGLRVVVVDLPGHGSTAAWPTVRPDGVATALAALVEERGLGRPLVVGHSWGALAAAALVLTHPSRGLVTLDQGLRPEDLPVPPSGLPVGGAEKAASLLRGVIDASLEPQALPAAVVALLDEVRPRTPDVLVPYLRALEGTTAAELLGGAAAGLAQLDIPLRHVRRGTSDHEDAAGTEVWPATSHCLHLEHPQRLADLLLTWTQNDPRMT